MAENLETNDGLAETEENTENKNQTPQIDSKYRLILLAAQRSKQLQKGAAPRISADPRRMKPTRIALEEFKNGKVHFDLTETD